MDSFDPAFDLTPISGKDGDLPWVEGSSKEGYTSLKIPNETNSHSETSSPLTSHVRIVYSGWFPPNSPPPASIDLSSLSLTAARIGRYWRRSSSPDLPILISPTPTMADLEHLVRAVGGDRGTTVVATSLIFTITSWVSVFLAGAYADKGNVYMITKIEHRDRKVIFAFLCYSSIALCVATVIEHVYILIIVGPRTILSRHIPPSIRGRLTFNLILTSYWVSFAGGQACLIIAMINLWHGRVLKIFSYVYFLMFLVVLFTLLLHVRANSIRRRLLDITWIDGFTSIVQAQNVEDCVICLETHSVGERMRSLPCGHNFHQVCVDDWLLRNPSCPLCRWTFLG